jgi:hypothetical protein
MAAPTLGDTHRSEQQRCPRCAHLQSVAAHAAQQRCEHCGAGWAWAECGSCGGIACPLDTMESWRCRCGKWNRSWWKAGDLKAEQAVVARRKADARMFGSTLRIVLVALVALVVLVMLATTPWRPSTASNQSGGAATACARYYEWRSRVSAGTRADVGPVAQAAASATPAVRDAASRLQAGTDSNAQLAAMGAMDAACDAARSG